MGLPAPALAVNPLGWIVIGAAGFLAYKVGKRAGLKAEPEADKPGLGDRAVKGAMKTMIRAKKSVSQSLSGTKEKYNTMWQEAQTEAKDPA